MSTFNPGPEDITSAHTGFNPGHFQDLRNSYDTLSNTVAQQTAVLGDHQGNLRGLATAISAVQASLAAKITLIATIASLLAGLGVWNLTRTATVGDRIDGLSGRVGALEVQSGIVQAKLSVLPQQVAHELRQQEQDAARSTTK